MIRIFFEAIPILMALIAILACGKRAILTSNRNVRLSSALAVFCAALMIAAQVSWSWSMFIQNSLLGTELANVMWTVFNTLVMCKFIYAAMWRDV